MVADRRVVAFLALAVLVGCGPGHPTPYGHSVSPPVEVRIAVAGTTLTPTLTLPARVKAAEEVTLNARTAGRVTRFVALEGQPVRSGQIVVRFDAPEAERAKQAARSERDAAQSALEVAARQHARIESLFVSRVVAAADREAAASQHQSAKARVAAAEAQLSAATAASEVRAPFDGFVVRRRLDPGADVSPGTPLVDLRSRGAVELITAVPEAALASLAKAQFLFQAADGPWLGARLTRVDGMTDPSTRTRIAHLVPVDRVVLEPGTYARVRIVGAVPAASAGQSLSVPVGSVVQRGALRGVFIAEGDHAVLRWLRLGRTEGDRIEVLSGLEPGDSVIQQAAGLTDGAAVKFAR